MLESFGFYDDYKPTLRILQEGLGNGGASALLFFWRFLYYHTWIWYNLQEYFSDYIKKRRERMGFRRRRHCAYVYNSPFYGVVGNIVCRMWESCLLLFHVLWTVLSMTEWGVMHISTMRFQALNRRFFVLFTGQGCYFCPAVPVRLSAALCALNTGWDFPVSGSEISVPYHSFCKWRSVLSSAW